jgi:hypothetical protein
MGAVYDNSEPFKRYLAKEGMERTLNRTKLKWDQKHTVVPHVSLFLHYTIPLVIQTCLYSGS